jgi:hypothetical protein
MVEELRPDLFRIRIPLPDSPLKFLNSYVVRSAERNLVIDTGLNRKVCLEAMKAGLEELKIDPDRTDFFHHSPSCRSFRPGVEADRGIEPGLFQPTGC